MNDKTHEVYVGSEEFYAVAALNDAIHTPLEQARGVLGFVLDNGGKGTGFSVSHMHVMSCLGAIQSLLDTAYDSHSKLSKINTNKEDWRFFHSEIDILLGQCKGILQLLLDNGEVSSWFSVSHCSVMSSLAAVCRLLDMAEKHHASLWLLSCPSDSVAEEEEA